MRRTLGLAFVLVPAVASAQGPAIEHDAVKCIVVGQYSRLSACLTPAEQVAQARVYFRPDGLPSWHFVAMTKAEQCFEGVLPKATKALLGRNVEYYLEGADRAFAAGRTAQYAARVVRHAQECGNDPVAPFAPKGPPAVFPSVPAGFAPLSGVSTLTVLGVVGAGAAGGGTALALRKGDDAPVPTGSPGTSPPASQPQGAPPVTPPPTPPTTPPSLVGLRVVCEADPRTGTVPLRVKFQAHPAGGTGVYDFLWQFGDGTSSTQVSPGHTYETAGHYAAMVRVTSGGQTATCERVIDAGRAPGPCDTRVAPTVTLIAPASGATVSGPTSLQAAASASVAIDRVEFYARDLAGGSATLVGIAAAAPYQTTWTPPPSCGGSFELYGKVVDTCGGTAESAPSTVVARTDTVPPTVSSVGVQDATPPSLDCGDTVTVVASASDNLGVTSVALFADGVSLGSDPSAPYTAPWSVPAGPSPTARVLRAEARDTCGNVGSGQVTVSVSCGRPLVFTKEGGADGTVADDQTPRQIDCGPGCTSDSGSYGFGTQVTLHATPAPGARFAGWTGCPSPTGPCVLTMDAGRSVRASFEPLLFNLTLTKSGGGGGTVSSKPPGIACDPSCTTQTAPFRAGSGVQLTAQAAPGSIFTGWSGACTGPTCQLTMNDNLSVTANFELQRFTLNVIVSGGGGGLGAQVTGPGINCGIGPGQTDCTETYTSGSGATLTAADGRLLNWNRAVPPSCLVTPPPLTCSVVMDQDRDVAAVFAFLGSPASAPGPPPVRAGSLAWMSDLGVPGASGPIIVNGQVAASAPPGPSSAILAVRPGENRVEARLTQASGRPGLWRFELQEKGRLEPGSLRVLQGEAAQVTGDAVVFRLRGQVGETVAFSFRLLPEGRQ